jgi:TRAP-type C4-dicarboxylate transport system permease small subunit
MPWRARRAVNIGAQLLVIAFFALLGGVGVWITPILATDTLVSLPWIPMSVVQSVIPITAALIIVAEFTHLVELIAAKRPPPQAGQSARRRTQ